MVRLNGLHNLFKPTVGFGSYGYQPFGETTSLAAPAENKPITLSCPKGQAITVNSADYGANCKAKAGNATEKVAQICNGRNFCYYWVMHEVLGDPCFGTPKTFDVSYSCSPASLMQGSAFVSRESSVSHEPNKHAHLKCPLNTKIAVTSATYGTNCPKKKEGNATADVARECDERESCNYKPDLRVVGDPCFGVPKDFEARWECRAPITPEQEAALAKAFGPAGSHPMDIQAQAAAASALTPELMSPTEGGDSSTLLLIGGGGLALLVVIGLTIMFLKSK